MNPRTIPIGIIVILIAGGIGYSLGRKSGMAPAGMPSATIRQTPPLVSAFAKGVEVTFLHTETSDENVARLLTMMMGSPVIHVPALREVPNAALGAVYVFTNGVRGSGPMGFQPDIFDTVPGDAGYTPLRFLHLVTWKPNVEARELRSTDELEAARARGELTIAQPGVVITMPLVSWPGGKR